MAWRSGVCYSSPIMTKPAILAPARRERARRWLWAALAASTLWLSAQAHRQAGFTLPSPWNDEPWYLWSAISVAEHGTLFSESLNPERVVPMSPAYQVPLGAFFKLAGFSFALARWTSWFWMALAYVGVLWLVKSRPFPLVSAAAAALFFLGATAVVAGNVCRPEAMVLALATWSFVCADRDRPWPSLALAGIGALVHQVGVMYFAGAAFFFAWRVWASRPGWRPARTDWWLLGLALAALAGQVVFWIRNWTWIWADAAAVAGENMQQDMLQRIWSSPKTAWLGAYGVLFLLALWRFRPLRIPAALGGISLSAMLVRPQMWYEIYNQMGFMWLALVIPWTACYLAGGAADRWWPRIGGNARRVWVGLVFGAALLPMLRFGQMQGFITGPRNYPAKLEWGWGMRMDPAPYLTEADIQAVAREIEKHVADGRPRRVFFMPEGDALFFHGRLPTNAIPYQGVRTTVLGDLAVFRISRHPPRWWTKQYVMRFLRLYGGEGLAPFRERDGTEQWILVPPRER